jgi:Notch-like protein
MFVTTIAWAGPGNKIEICHFPPGNPDNFHTITINENAWTAHQLHGDMLGSCLANCGTICGDVNKCTIDYDAEAQDCVCLSDHPPVNCDDGLDCTDDSCAPADGCQYVNNCDDGNDCTANLCSNTDGTCSSTNVENGTPCDDGNGVCTDGVCGGTAGACENHLCQNNGDCVPNSDGTTYTCDCLPGFTGMYCEIDPCAFEHCENGGTCMRGDDGTTYTCDCLPGYSGDHCENAP